MTDHADPSVKPWRLPVGPRDPLEAHRAATNLELLFDLCFVVAVAYAGVGLHHAIAANHAGTGVVSYLTVFFAIWWAWMNSPGTPPPTTTTTACIGSPRWCRSRAA